MGPARLVRGSLSDGTLDEPWPPGEYDTYASWLLRSLLGGADKAAVIHLMSRARQVMGTDDPRGHDDRAADALLAWWHSRETSYAAMRSSTSEVILHRQAPRSHHCVERDLHPLRLSRSPSAGSS